MLLIKDATIFTEEESLKRDILIEDKKIVRIEESIDLPNIQSIDANGCYLLPGIIDLNVRVKDQYLTLDHIDRLIQKAKKSGVSSIVLMPYFSPAIEDKTSMELLKERVDSMDLDIFLSIKATKTDDIKTLNDISIMCDNGAMVIQENSYVDGNILRRILQYSLMKERTFFCYSNNPVLNDNGVMHEGEISAKLGLSGISKISEISEVAKVSSMSEYYGAKTLFQSLSTKKSLDIIASLKENGAEIFSELSILHLILSDRACEDFNTLAKIDPPLRDEEERLALLQALQDKKIDTLTSLHSAVSYNSKDVAFEDASYGVDSLEYLLSLSYTYLVREGIIDFFELSKLLSANPASILGLDRVGEIKEGYFANLVIFDPKKEYIVEDEKSLFYKMRLRGEVVKNIYKGDIL